MKKISLFPHLCIVWMKKKLFVSTSHVKKFMMAKYHYFFIGGGGGRGGGGKEKYNLLTLYSQGNMVSRLTSF